MKVMSDRFRAYAEEALHMIERLPEEQQRLVVLHVSDVLAENSVVPGGQAKRVLEFCAYSNHVRYGPAEIKGSRRETARSPPQQSLPAKDSSDGIVYRGPDRAVVSQAAVGQALQTPQILFLAHDRLLAEISAGHHQRAKLGVREQQMMQRRIRQHHAEVRVSGSHKGKIAFDPLSQQHDGPLRAEQQIVFRWRDFA